MPLHLPDLAPILARIESIVYEQERRIDGGEPVGAPDTLNAMDDDELDAALHKTEEAACDLIADERMTDAEHQGARAYLHATLMDYADAINNENRVLNAAHRPRAVCEVARISEYARAIITYPRAIGLFEALDNVETDAERHYRAHDTDEHMTSLRAAIAAMNEVRRLGPPGAEVESKRLAFVMLLGDYLRSRYAPTGTAADTLLRVAAELDDARTALADAYVRQLDATGVMRSSV